MRQVWRYGLFGLGVIGVIWGIVMLFSQVWQALLAFVLALVCFTATRLVASRESKTGSEKVSGTAGSDVERVAGTPATNVVVASKPQPRSTAEQQTGNQPEATTSGPADSADEIGGAPESVNEPNVIEAGADPLGDSEPTKKRDVLPESQESGDSW